MTNRIDVVGVIGAGTMGHGIAQTLALAGCRVNLADARLELAEAGRERARRNLNGGVARGKLSAEDAEAAAGRIHPGVGEEHACLDADLVIEAIAEDMDLKCALLERVDHLAAPACLIASNTSSLSLTQLQMATSRPELVLGLHFFNPVHIMKLVEVVRGERTAASSIQRGVELARRLGKEPIVVSDSPGFATSRLGIALGNEAMRMLEQGVASASAIDTAMELGYRHPMGPLKLSDLVGLDVRLAITEYLYAEIGSDTFRPPQILRRLVRAGKLGRKTGEGFYTYDEGT